jgi:tol-pal system protein YbgF
LQQESVKAIQEARIKEAELRAKEASLAAEMAKTRSKSANSDLRSSDSTKQIRLDHKKVKLNVDAQAASESQPKVSQPEQVVKTAPQQIAPQQITAEPATQPTVEQQPLDDFAKAQKLYENNKFKEAFQLFEQVAANTSGNNKVDARFMMGECLFQQKEYDKAIMQYQNIISQHSDHAKSPKAMLKQGMAFEKLADKDTAKVIYKKLLKKHASSPEAATAQEILSKL